MRHRGVAPAYSMSARWAEKRSEAGGRTVLRGLRFRLDGECERGVFGVWQFDSDDESSEVGGVTGGYDGPRRWKQESSGGTARQGKRNQLPRVALAVLAPPVAKLGRPDGAGEEAAG